MSGYYPGNLTENSPNTPWNEKEVPEKEFDLTCSQSLSRTVKVLTNDYAPIVTKEYDDMGGFVEEFADTSDTNWKEVYDSNDYHTPLQLISILKTVLQTNLKEGVVFVNPRLTNRLIQECDNWVEDETEFNEN